MSNFHLKIVTPDGSIFNSDAQSVRVRTDMGDVEIMRGHVDYFAPLGTGEVKLTYDGNIRFASSSGGFISVKNGEVKLVATTFEFADEIDINRAKAAKEKAEAALQRAKNEKELLLAKYKLQRALNRIKVASGER